MNAAKIRLSPTEMELVMNAECILTKNSILKKVNDLLNQLQMQQREYLHGLDDKLPEKVLRSSPKISRGDNYNGFPWLVLDYPKHFDRSTIFAIRVMFLWGNFFSITLHLAGDYKMALEKKIIAALPVLKEQQFYCCINEEQWEHHFENNNYLPVVDISAAHFEKIVGSNSFIKLAKKIPLDKWDEADNLLLSYFRQIINVVVD